MRCKMAARKLCYQLWVSWSWSIYAFSVLRQEYPDLQFWVIVGPPKKQSVYHIGQIFENLGEQKCKALPFFTAFTGCDTTSQFVNKGKLSAWNAWMAYPQATDVFLIEPFEEIETSTERFEIIERYVCILYNRTTAQTSINKLRELLFSKKEFSMLPPIPAALLQHVRRSVYQSSIWLKSLDCMIHASDPSEECSVLLKCGCKAIPICQKNCRCRKVWGLPCTHLCSCEGQCINV